jgi:hypothetical protein
MKRILLAGIFAGVVVFAFSAFDHTVLPIGHIGLKSLPQEDAVVTAMRAGITERGLYFFPGMDMSRKPTAEEEKAYVEKYVKGPTGLLVYSPGGEAPMMPRQLGTELLTNILAGCIAAFVVSLMAGPFGRRVIVVTLLGVFAWISISLSNWIWYGFPAAYILAEGFDQVGGWLLGGFVIAWMYRKS